jgi:uncharacterized protein YciI
VHYTYSDATVPGRDETRPAHRAWLNAQFDAGFVRSSGPYPDGSGALVIVEAGDLDAAQKTLAEDPFSKAGLIDNVRVVEWKPVTGAFS